MSLRYSAPDHNKVFPYTCMVYTGGGNRLGLRVKPLIQHHQQIDMSFLITMSNTKSDIKERKRSDSGVAKLALLDYLK